MQVRFKTRINNQWRRQMGSKQDYKYNHRIGKLRDAAIRLAKMAIHSKDNKEAVQLAIDSYIVNWAVNNLRESCSFIDPTKEAIEARAKEMHGADPTNRISDNEDDYCFQWTAYEFMARQQLTQEMELQGQAADPSFKRVLDGITSRQYEASTVSVEGEGKLEYIKGNLTPEKIEEMIEMSNAMTAMLEANYFKTHESPFTITTEKS